MYPMLGTYVFDSVSLSNSSRLQPIIAVGCDDAAPSSTGKVILYELTDGMR